MKLFEVLQRSGIKSVTEKTFVYGATKIRYVHPEQNNLPNDFKAGFNRSLIFASNDELYYWCWVLHAPNKVPQIGDSVRLSHFDDAEGLIAVAL